MMLSRSSSPSPSYIVCIRCLAPSTDSSPHSSLIITPSNSNHSLMATTKTTPTTNSFGFSSIPSSSNQTTCAICKRLLYSFEEVLFCRSCHGSYHWRCVKPETISHYGENAHFICDKCDVAAADDDDDDDGVKTTTATSSASHRTIGGIQILSPESADTDYRDFVNIPSSSMPKIADVPPTDNSVINTVRYFEEKQQQSQQTHKLPRTVELESYPTSQTNGGEFYYRNGGQFGGDGRTTRRIHQQPNGIESDDENAPPANMFQTNYQYTPLRDYAATRSGRPTGDNSNNIHQTSPSDNSDRLSPSRYGGGLRYSNHGYDPTVARAVEPPASGSNQFTSPTIDSLSVHNRKPHFVSSTNLTINDTSSRRQPPPQSSPPISSLSQTHIQQHDNTTHHKSSLNSLVHATPNLPASRDEKSVIDRFVYPNPLVRPSGYPQSQQQSDRHSAVDSESGIVMVDSQHQQMFDDHPEQQQGVEKKISALVEQLGRQLETDTQKISAKLELKLKNLEDMINQQTYIIRRQDEVIERLKNKISKIESERDSYRDRLSTQEQQFESNGMKKTTTTNGALNESFVSTTETMDDDVGMTNQYDLITGARTRRTPSSSSANDNKSAATGDTEQVSRQPSNVPLSNKYSSQSSVVTDNKSAGKKAPAPRAGQQWSTTNGAKEPSLVKSANDITHNDDRRASDSSSSVQSGGVKLVGSGPIVDKPAAASRLDNMINQSNTKDAISQPTASYNLAQVRHTDRAPVIEPVAVPQQEVVSSVHRDDYVLSRRHSTSSSSSSTPREKPSQSSPTGPVRNTNLHRSLESIPRTSLNEQQPRPPPKTTSLEFGAKPGRFDDPESIYITRLDAHQPANQFTDTMKGWLRKQNRDSFFKRIERFYFVLRDNALWMYRRDTDTAPHKAVNLKGAKVVYYDDPKHGPSLELNWSNRQNEPKHYHLYAPTPQEAHQWVSAIQAVALNLENKAKGPNKWQQYRMTE